MAGSLTFPLTLAAGSLVSVPSVGLVTVTVGASVSRMIETVAGEGVVLPALSVARKAKLLTPSTKATATLKLESACSSTALPFTVSVPGSLTEPLMTALGWLVRVPLAGEVIATVGGVVSGGGLTEMA